MRATQLLSLSGLAFMMPALLPLASAQQGQPVAGYQLLRTITIPGGLAGNDISWVDSANARYYLADRGNATASPVVGPTIDVIDTQNDAFITSIPLPTAGNGILAIPRAHELWVGLNDSTIAVIDTGTNSVTHIVSTGGTARADEMAYDPDDRLILIANDRDTPPFVSFVSTAAYSVVKRSVTTAPQPLTRRAASSRLFGMGPRQSSISLYRPRRRTPTESTTNWTLKRRASRDLFPVPARGRVVWPLSRDNA